VIEVISLPAVFQRQMTALRARGSRIGFVPTMGFLHDGHLALIAEARRRADVAALSIFVNPLQFAPTEDLSRYPRDLAGDLEKAERAGASVAFVPNTEDLYPAGFQTEVTLTQITQRLEGASRPTHFRGVATVVLKLLLLAQADVAVFGEKDYQQLLVVKQLVRDLCVPTTVVGLPTVREPDGLAMSSRNKYLDAAQRRQALVLKRALDTMVAAATRGERSREALVTLATEIVAREARVDYVEVADADTLEPHPQIAPYSRALVAAFVGATRLIDNVAIGTALASR
jgi:pantoate--beta-alanine ligase